MSDREKLVELIDHVCEGHVANLMQPGGVETLADYLIAHGVTVLQVQKPLTVEEVRALQDFAWLEWINGNRVEPMVSSGIERDTSTNAEYFTFSGNGYALMSNYGKTWRCWAEKPTDAEREAAEWE